MSVWAKRRLVDWSPLFDRFEAAFLALNGPRDMLMVAANKAWDATAQAHAEDIIIRVPEQILEGFGGFEKMPATSLPDEASLLIGHQDEFERVFRFPTVGRL